MIWSILIATHVSRDEKFGRLVEQLAPQLTDDVEVVVLWNRGGRSIGEYRQALMMNVSAEFACFVDDDDRISDDYCARILAAFDDDPDYVGFEVAVKDRSPTPISRKYRDYVAYHSLQYDGWFQEGNRFYRDVSHLNPVRRVLASRAPFVGVRGEDHEWARQVRPHLKTETYIDWTLYFYDFDQSASIRSGKAPDETRSGRPLLPGGFRYHPDSEE